MGIHSIPPANEIATANFDSLRSEGFWREWRDKYPVGAQWADASHKAVSEVVETVNAALADTPITVALWYGLPQRRTKKPIGIKVESGLGSTETIRLEIKSSLVIFAGRPVFLGSSAAVVTLAHRIVDEIERVVTADAKYAARGRDNV